MHRFAAAASKHFRRCGTFARMVVDYARRKGGWGRALSTAFGRLWSLARELGVRELGVFLIGHVTFAARNHGVKDGPPPWANWLREDESRRALEVCSRQPLVSLVLVVDSARPGQVTETIASVVAQHYANWELILIDRTGDPRVGELISAEARREPRLRPRTVHHPLGAALAANVGIDLARGAFVGFLRQGDRLTVDALGWVVMEHNRRKDAIWFYSDDVTLSPDESQVETHLKPDFSPEHLLSVMFTRDLSVYARDLLRQAGGFREEAEGAHHHDLALRLSETVDAGRVVHIPRVLYLGRPDAGAKSAAASEAGRRAVADALARRGLKGDVTVHEAAPDLYRVRLRPRSFPKVSLFVSTKNASELVKQCVASMRAKTRYPNYEIVVINNQSDEPELLRYLGEATAAGVLRVFDYDRPFNHSEMHNEAVAACDSEYVVLVNNDIEILSDDWLEQMVAATELDPAVGGVGALLFYPDGSVQHGGILMGLSGGAGHAHRGLPPGRTGYNHRLEALQEFSGATAALLLLRRSAYLEVGGFNARGYPTSFNDVDLWLRLRKAGYRCLYDPAVRALHYESKTRPLVATKEIRFLLRLRNEWADVLDDDPFYNPNLCRENELFQGYRHLPAPQLPAAGPKRRLRAA